MNNYHGQYFAPTGSQQPGQKPANARPINAGIGRIPIDSWMRKAPPESTIGGAYR